MLQKLKKNDNKGFTIIEVMIVLAIAGLIMLIVFLAVPALQRNSRNTQRKNDASGIASTIANYISNNNGALPTSLGKNSSNTNLDICQKTGSATGNNTACSGNQDTAKLGYYTADNVYFSTYSSGLTLSAGKSGDTASAAKVTPESVTIVAKASCNDADTTTPTTSPRSAAIFYTTESGSSTTLQCVEQ